jgi:hypothetical protein
MGVVYFLLGTTASESSEEKFDYKGDMSKNGTLIEDISSWKKNVPPHNRNGYIFPQRSVAEKYGYSWQIQAWNLFRNEFVHGQVQGDIDIITEVTFSSSEIYE